MLLPQEMGGLWQKDKDCKWQKEERKSAGLAFLRKPLILTLSASCLCAMSDSRLTYSLLYSLP